MDVKELRIGNLITYAGRVGKVTQLDSEEGVYFDGLDSSHLNGLYEDGFEGIPLTEEWLLNLGFRRGSDCLVLELDGPGSIIFENGLVELIAGKYSEGEFYCKNIKYVYQIQNLYFALQGEELKVKALTTDH